MKKKVLPVLLTAGMLLLAGCGTGSATQSTIEVKAKGTIVQTTIETLDVDYLDSDELKTYVKDQVDAYNEGEDAAGTVKLKKYRFSESDDTVTLILKFSDADTYADFEQMTFFSGTVEEAKASGFDFGVVFIAPEDAATSSGDASGDTEKDSSGDTSGSTESGDAEIADGTADLNLSGEEQVIILQESYNVTVPGTLLYVTEGACGYVSEDTVSVDADEADLIYIIYE